VILGRRGRRPLLPTATRHRPEQRHNVAILGRRGRRPLLLDDLERVRIANELRSSAAADGGRCLSAYLPFDLVELVAILGRRGRRPLLRSSSRASRRRTGLRSSAAADGGRCA